jgi:hypothetical protein
MFNFKQNKQKHAALTAVYRKPQLYSHFTRKLREMQAVPTAVATLGEMPVEYSKYKFLTGR